MDAPVCDLNSWPRQTSVTLYEDARQKWQQCGVDIDSISDYPIKHFNEIRCLPLVLCYGDNDTIVPFKDNFSRTHLLPDSIHRIIRKRGAGHHPHSLTDPTPIVDFIDSHTKNDRLNQKSY